MNLLVIDVGTTSMRRILYREDGKVLGMKRVLNHVRFGAQGHVTEPVSDWDQNLKTIFCAIVDTCGAERSGRG